MPDQGAPNVTAAALRAGAGGRDALSGHAAVDGVPFTLALHGNAKNGITCAQARRHAATTVGNLRPHSPSANASNAAAAASALVAA